MQTPDILDIVPEHVADPVRRAPWRLRVRTGGADLILSLLLNGLVVAGLIGVGWPLHLSEAPSAISVDLVDHMPGTKPGGTPSQATPAEKTAGADAETHATPAKAASTVARDAKATAEPDRQAALQPQPAPEPQAALESKPSADVATPSAEPAQDAERPAEVAGAASEAAPPPESPAPQSAAPPPPEHPDDRPESRLVEAPSAPPPAPTRSETPATAVPPPPEARQAEASAEPAAQRPVLSAPDGSDMVAMPTPPPEAPKPLTAEQQRQAAATATLAAMLPFGTNIEASPFQAAVPSQGQGASTAYRGAVYANFNKAQDVIAEAKARHLKGQAVIAFTIDDRGSIATIGVAVSSGNPAVDQAALELIRRAAPFPPPPPGAQRTFSPAIGLGLDE